MVHVGIIIGRRGRKRGREKCCVISVLGIGGNLFFWLRFAYILFRVGHIDFWV